jgi:hypothetical protein
VRDEAPFEKMNIVAVFSGTTSSLANFYNEIPASTTTRDHTKENKGWVGQSMYPPFYSICSIGCLVDDPEIRLGFTGLDTDMHEAEIECLIPGWMLIGKQQIVEYFPANFETLRVSPLLGKRRNHLDLVLGH